MEDPTRKTTFGDFVSGYVGSFRQGTFRNPFAVKRNINAARDERLGRMAVAAATGKAVDKWLLKVNRTDREIQYTTADANIKVSSGWSRDLRQPVTDIVVKPKHGNTKEHLHVVIDQYGNTIYEQWNDDH